MQFVCGFMLLLKCIFCMQAPVKPPAAGSLRKKDSSSSSEESDSEDEQPAKAAAPSQFVARGHEYRIMQLSLIVN